MDAPARMIGPPDNEPGRYLLPRERGQVPEFLARRGEQLADARREYVRVRRRIIDCCLLVDAREAGDVVGVNERTWRRLDATGQVPAPVKIGRLNRWRLKELAAWVRAGCPDREAWEAR